VPTPPTILVVDDDPVTLQLLGTALRQQGYRVMTAMDATQGMMTVRRGSPDIVLLDVMLPGGGGVDTLKKLKTNSQTQLIPVIAMSSSDDAALPSKVEALGAVGFLKKPVDLAKLSELLERVKEQSG
jgi:CheY-like chemotaxis protein